MRILIVSQYFWPEQCPLNDLALGLKERGHEITVFTGMPNYPKGSFYKGYSFCGPRKENFNDIKVIRMPLFPRGKGGRFRLIINYLSFAFFSCLLAPFYCKGKYDLLFNYQTSPITASLPAIVLKKIKRIPMFLWVQDLWPDSVLALNAISSPIILRILTKLVKVAYKNSDCILVQSKAFISKVADLAGNNAKIHYLPNWADKNYYPCDPVVAKTKINDMPSGFVVMYAGNVGQAQSFDAIFDAMKMSHKYNEIHWVIIGDGSKFNWLKQQVITNNLENNVHLLGRKPSAIMPDYFALASVLLVSLKNTPLFYLTIPSKIQAYLACGRPILAALSGTGAEIIKEAKAGIVVDPENGNMLIKGVEEIYAMDNRNLEKMGREGRCYYEKNFDHNVIIDKLEKWAKEFI
jgi:glycosyltransferase involved in cell wall biosynthesis